MNQSIDKSWKETKEYYDLVYERRKRDQDYHNGEKKNGKKEIEIREKRILKVVGEKIKKESK